MYLSKLRYHILLGFGLICSSTMLAQSTNETSLTIESGVVITSETSLTNKTGATLSVPNGAELAMKESLTNNGTLDVSDGELTISGASTINGDLEVATLNIDANAVFNDDLIVTGVVNLLSGQLDVSGSSLTIASDANGTAYIDDFSSGNSGTINGDITVQRYIPGSGIGFHYIGSAVASSGELADLGGEMSLATMNGATDGRPITPLSTASNCNTSELAPGSAYGGAFEFDESIASDCMLSGWVVRSAGDLDVAKGLAARIEGGTTIDLTGAYQTGTVTSYALSATGNNTASPNFNLVSNPYASYIQWDAVAANNTGDISGTAYVWQSSGGFSGTYQSYNSIVKVNIASQQSFFVEALNDGATIDFREGVRRTSSTPSSGSMSFLRQDEAAYSKLGLTVTGNNFADVTYIAFANSFTADLDNGFDARKIKSKEGQPTLYTNTNADAGMQGINALPFADTTEVPVGFIAGADGAYSITADGLGSFTAGTDVYLQDHATGTFTDLRQNPTYAFTAQATDDAERFTLVFAKQPQADTTVAADSTGADDATTGITQLPVSELKLYPNPTTDVLNIELAADHANGEVLISDLAGRTVHRQNISEQQQQYQINMQHLNSGLYLVRVQVGDQLSLRKLIKQ